MSFLYMSTNNGLFACADDALPELQKEPTFLSVSSVLINVVYKVVNATNILILVSVMLC